MVTKTREELEEMETLIAAGKLAPTAIQDHYNAEAKNVFGHDAKKDAKGNYIEQGLGSAGHETANHFATMLKEEQRGNNPPGTYEAELAKFWKRDPARAEKLRLPRPRAAA